MFCVCVRRSQCKTQVLIPPHTLIMCAGKQCLLLFLFDRSLFTLHPISHQPSFYFSSPFIVYYIKARHWLGYLELELKHANFNEVENLFTRCLKTVLSVDLWKFYLNYIRRINSTDDSKLESDTRTVIEKAYDYVLNNVGIDKDSGPIWSDYIFFLKNAEVK